MRLWLLGYNEELIIPIIGSPAIVLKPTGQHKWSGSAFEYEYAEVTFN